MELRMNDVHTHDTSPSRNLWKMCSFDRIGWRAMRLRNVWSMRFRRAIIAASSFAFACLIA